MPSSGCRPISPQTAREEDATWNPRGGRKHCAEAPGGTAPPEPSRPSEGRLRAQPQKGGRVEAVPLQLLLSSMLLYSVISAGRCRSSNSAASLKENVSMQTRDKRHTVTRSSLSARQSGCQARSARHSAHPPRTTDKPASLQWNDCANRARQSRRLCPHSPRTRFPAQVPPGSNRMTST